MRSWEITYPLNPAAWHEGREIYQMMESIITALITGGLALAGVIITNLMAARKSESAMKTAQAVTDTKIEALTREVREHNDFARRVPLVEAELKRVNHRIENLEGFHKGKNGWEN